jgi:hypothetical protein
LFIAGYHGNGIQKTSEKAVFLGHFDVKILNRATYAKMCVLGI